MSIVNTEDKEAPATYAPVTVNAANPLIQALPVPSQGTTGSARIGDSILVNRIDMDLTFQYSGTAATATYADQTFRYWVVRYLKTPSTSGTSNFNLSEFLNVDSNTQYTTSSLMNTDTNQNFQVMVTGDVVVKLPTLASAQLTVSKTIPIRHSCHFHQLFNGSSASNITSNMVFLVVVALNPSNAAGISQVTNSSRVWYVDN